MKRCAILFFIISTALFAQTNEMLNRFRLGQSYEQAGDIQKAKSIYEELYNKQPDNFQFFDALNRMYIQLKEYDNSIRIINDRIKLQPGDINMTGLLGNIYYQKGEEQKAFEIWDKALQTTEPNFINYRIIANYAIERRAFDKAIEILKKGKNLDKENVEGGINSSNFSYDLANIYTMLMKYREAAEEYCYVLSKEKSQLNMVESRISTYINKPDAVKTTIEVVLQWEDKTGDMNFTLLLAWLYMEDNQFEKALEGYSEADEKTNSGGQEIFNFAQRALQEEHFNEASEAYKKINDKYPNSPFAAAAKIGFAKTLESALNKKYEQVQWKPFFPNNAVNKEEYANVINAYSELLKNNTRSEQEAEARYRIGVIKYEKLSDYDGAKAEFNSIIQNSNIFKYVVLSYFKLGEIFILNNDLEGAIENYNKIINFPRAAPEDKNYANYMIARIEFWQGNFPFASSILQNVTSSLSDDYANDAIELAFIINTTKNDSLNLLLFANAELLAYQDKFNEAAVVYEKLQGNQNLLSIKDIAAFRRAEMMIAVNKYPEAIVMLEQVSDLKENSVYSDEALFLLGKLYQYGINDVNKAQESYEKLLANFPNSLYLDDAREKINSIRKTTNNL